MIEWENGEITSEPLAADLAAVTCAIYGHSGRPPDEDKRETSGTLVDLVLTEAPTMVSMDKTYASSSSTMVGMLTFVALTSLFTLLIEAPMMGSLDNNYASSSTLVGMLTFVALASLFTAFVEPSLPRSLPSITSLLACCGISSKFGNCSALYDSSSRAMSLDLEADFKVTK